MTETLEFSPTSRFADLTEAEQLALRSIRCWLQGGRPREWLWRTLAYDFGADEGSAVLRGLEAMIRALTAHAHRNISYHQPCCPCIGVDEAGLLTLVAAAQQGEPELLCRVACDFVQADGLPALLAAAEMFAAPLLRAAPGLPLRFARRVGMAAAPHAAGATLH